MSTPRIVLTPAASKLAGKGRPWFYADDLATVEAADGGLVRVESHRGDDLGLGMHSARSRLRLRRCGPWAGDRVPEPEQFFAERLDAAIACRAFWTEEPAGIRLVHGEADQLPGLVVDRYDRCLVLQSTTVAVERFLTCIVPHLRSATGAVSVLARNDVPVRRREGLPEEVRLLDGRRIEEVSFQEHGIRHRARLVTGQKTGFFLDQRPARRRVMELAQDRQVLDLCCYQGGFALAALRGGARRVVAVDVAEAALAQARQGAADNGMTGLETTAGDVFDWLREARRRAERYDLVILDPPAFARRRQEVDGAIRGYRDLNRLALRILAPGGYLLTCSCSHHVRSEAFETMLRQAAAELPFAVWLRERIAAGADHPVALHLPESEYLKVVLLQRAP